MSFQHNEYMTADGSDTDPEKPGEQQNEIKHYACLLNRNSNPKKHNKNNKCADGDDSPQQIT
jgi:hypothetical protein